MPPKLPSPPSNTQAISQAISSQINPTSFSEKFPTLNIPALLDTFRDVCINGTPQKPIPNPYRYRNFALAFNQWCLKRLESQKHQPARNSTSFINDFLTAHNSRG